MVEKTLFIVDRREPVWKSWASDAFTFSGLIGTALALNTLMPPSGWLNAAIAICWILWLLSKSCFRKVEKTPEQARAWLDAEYPRDGDA